MSNVKINNSAIEFRPPVAAHVNKTVSSSVVSFSASELPAANGSYVYLQVQDQNVRATYGGGDPTSTDGDLLAAGERTTLKRETVLAMKFIRAGASDGKIFAQQFTA
jgi:hypothetical protein